MTKIVLFSAQPLLIPASQVDLISVTKTSPARSIGITTPHDPTSPLLSRWSWFSIKIHVSVELFDSSQLTHQRPPPVVLIFLLSRQCSRGGLLATAIPVGPSLFASHLSMSRPDWKRMDSSEVPPHRDIYHTTYNLCCSPAGWTHCPYPCDKRVSA